MNTATKKKIGTATAALVLTGALFGASATAANAYPTGTSASVGYSDTIVDSGDAVKVGVQFLKPGTTATIRIDGKTYTTKAAGADGTTSVSIKVPKDAGVYTVTVSVPGEPTVSSKITVGTIVKTLTATAPSSVKRTKSFTIKGKLTATIKTASKKGASVVITYKVGKKSFKYTVKTDSSGSYSKALKITTPGKYKVTTTILGDAKFTAKTVAKTITVKK